MKRFLPLLGLVAVAVGLAFVMPAVAQWRREGNLPWWSALLLTLGVIVTAGGTIVALGIFRRQSR